MLIKQPQIRIVSREVTLATGEVVLAYFALVNIGGHVDVRFLGTKTKTADTETTQPGAILALPGICKRAICHVAKTYFSEYIASPFSTLLLLRNQLARAPSFN